MLTLLQTGREHNMADLLMSYPDFLARIFFLCWQIHDGKLRTASRVLESKVENGELPVLGYTQWNYTGLLLHITLDYWDYWFIYFKKFVFI